MLLKKSKQQRGLRQELSERRGFQCELDKEANLVAAKLRSLPSTNPNKPAKAGLAIELLST
ncbi:MAG TPA: hypothetical protein VK017_14180 [Sphingobacterium sp.]|nr:hypothetical protein [Sphingobacterium sp.]